MADVIVNVEKHADEQEKRRRQRFEERRAQQTAKQGAHRFNGEKRFVGHKDAPLSPNQTIRKDLPTENKEEKKGENA